MVDWKKAKWQLQVKRFQANEIREEPAQLHSEPHPYVTGIGKVVKQRKYPKTVGSQPYSPCPNVPVFPCLKNRYDVLSANRVAREVCFLLDLSVYLFLSETEEAYIYMFLVIALRKNRACSTAFEAVVTRSLN